MWGRVILGAMIVVLVVVWLAAVCLLVMDPQTLLQKWQRGLWNSANWLVLGSGAGYQLSASTPRAGALTPTKRCVSLL